MIIIQASNIHNGGGAVLLKQVLSALQKSGQSTVVFVDQRFAGLHDSETIKFHVVKATILNRLLVEFKIRKLAQSKDQIIYFGNLPPLMPVSGRVILFFQNVILLDKFKNFGFSFKTRVKHEIERCWLKWGLSYVSQIIVQSESTKRDFLSQFTQASVEVAAFNETAVQGPSTSTAKQGFLYVASSDPHKNLNKLIEAWTLLHCWKMDVELILTADISNHESKELVSAAQSQGVKIQVRSALTHQQVLDLYRQVQALIYPSLAESFGLPLLEADRAGLPILASELDFVRDLVKPHETFDPHSALSIARAVQRFLQLPESHRTQVLTAEQFLAKAIIS